MIVYRTVTTIYFPIIIGIYIFQISTTPHVIRLERTHIHLSQVIINLTVCHEKVVSLIPPNLTKIHPFIISFIRTIPGVIIVNGSIRIIIFGNDSLIAKHIESYAITKSTFQLIMPVHRKLPSAVTQCSIIYFRAVFGSYTTNIGNSFGRTNHIPCHALVYICF